MSKIRKERTDKIFFKNNEYTQYCICPVSIRSQKTNCILLHSCSLNPTEHNTYHTPMPPLILHQISHQPNPNQTIPIQWHTEPIFRCRCWPHSCCGTSKSRNLDIPGIWVSGNRVEAVSSLF